MPDKTIHIPYLLCASCLTQIRHELEKLEGVLSVEYEKTSKNVIVQWQAPATWMAIRNVLTEDGYPPGEATGGGGERESGRRGPMASPPDRDRGVFDAVGGNRTGGNWTGAGPAPDAGPC